MEKVRPWWDTGTVGLRLTTHGQVVVVPKHARRGQNDFPSADSVVEKIEPRREAFEDLSGSDLPCAEIAEALLEIAEEGT